MALTRARRDERRRQALQALRQAYRDRKRVTLTLQRGRKRPRVTGVVREVAVSGAFVQLDDGEPVPLHVPVEIIRCVERAA